MIDRIDQDIGLHINASCVLVLANESKSGRRILACSNRIFGGFTLPGGKFMIHENAKDCARRELEEETNLVTRVDDLVLVARGINEIEIQDGLETCDVRVFLSRHVDGQIKDVEEGTTHRWFRWDQFLAECPFKDFYIRHFPQGVDHFKSTIWSGQ